MSTKTKRAPKLPKISASKFTNRNCAQSNRVFLFENIDEPPYVRPVKGWKIVGYGDAPWPGNTDGFAVMLEKETPAKESHGTDGEEFPEGEQIWQHYRREWLAQFTLA